MNYLKEIVAFHEWLEINPLPPNAQVLWHQLMKVANKLCWQKEWFQVDNQRLMYYTSINNVDSLIRARNKLIDSGIIEYQKGKKGSPNSYKIIPFLNHVSENTVANNDYKPTENTIKNTTENRLKTRPKTLDINKHKTKTQTKTVNILCPNGFAEFWQAYPRKISKQQAQRAWEKLNPSDETMGLIIHALDRFKQSSQWIQNNGQYIPYPATWLNQRRWEDELSEPTNQGQSMPEDRRVTRYVSQGGYRDFSDLVE